MSNSVPLELTHSVTGKETIWVQKLIIQYSKVWELRKE